LLKAPGLISWSFSSGSWACSASGSRVMKSELAIRMSPVSSGTARITSWWSNASARPPIMAPSVKPMLGAARMKT
jgi:hypothetical protein